MFEAARSRDRDPSNSGYLPGYAPNLDTCMLPSTALLATRSVRLAISPALGRRRADRSAFCLGALPVSCMARRCSVRFYISGGSIHPALLCLSGGSVRLTALTARPVLASPCRRAPFSGGSPARRLTVVYDFSWSGGAGALS